MPPNNGRRWRGRGTSAVYMASPERYCRTPQRDELADGLERQPGHLGYPACPKTLVLRVLRRVVCEERTAPRLAQEVKARR